MLSTRTRRSSILQQPPTWGVNRTTIPAALCALTIGIFFCYVPALCAPLSPSSFLHSRADIHRVLNTSHHVFQTSNIPAKHFFIPMTFALALIVYVLEIYSLKLSADSFGSSFCRLDETRKLIVRKYPTSFLAWIAW